MGGDNVIVHPAAVRSLRIEAAVAACGERGLEVRRGRELPHGHGFWSVARVALLKRLWLDENLSAAEVAGRLGCTRNAVAGKIHRLRLTRAETVARRNLLRNHPSLRGRP